MERSQHASEGRAKTRFDFNPVAREYDRWYETDAGRAHDRVQKADVEALLPTPGDGAELLDVGCGTGHWSRFFAQLGYHVHGVDLSPDMVAVAEAEPAARCRFAVADAAHLPFPDARFDVAAAMAALEFVPDTPAVVREMARCTRPGGSLLIGTLNRLADLNRRRLAAGQEPYVSARLLTPDELEELLAPYGSVRMRASSPREGEADRHSRTRNDHRAPGAGRLRELDGPFIVAEVRT